MFTKSLKVREVNGRAVPEGTSLSGYSAILSEFNLKAPVPRHLFGCGSTHKKTLLGGWQILTPRHQPANTLMGHLTFALKYEGLDLLILKKVFERVGAQAIVELVCQEPNGAYSRRIWFLYEWLMDEEIDLPNAVGGRYINVLDTDIQIGAEGQTSTRHRVSNNLPGSRDFCPLVFRSDTINQYIDLDLQSKAKLVTQKIPKDIIARTAAFLLLKDSQSSYAIEGERAPKSRLEAWGRAIGEAGAIDLSSDELLRLQRMVIQDQRFVSMGLRKEGGFVGTHDRITTQPLPDHISARPDDLEALMNGMFLYDKKSKDADPVLSAAVLAFGFIYIHPFADGNGRLHRYILHHVLSQRGFNPPGMVFPISSAILDLIEEYKSVLESHSRSILPFIEWRTTESSNVEVINQTIDLYRYFDATQHVEFIFKCVRKTIEHDLPQEANFLYRYDRFCEAVSEVIDMPGSTISLLFNFLHQNDGILSARGRKNEFHLLGADEVENVQEMYANIFQRYPDREMVDTAATIYNGREFLMEDEARWAVFFDQIDISYEYIGTNIAESSPRLPRFKIQDFDVDMQIVPMDKGVSDDLLKHLAKKAAQNKRTIWIVEGAPSRELSNIRVLDANYNDDSFAPSPNDFYRLVQDRRDEGVFWLTDENEYDGISSAFIVGGSGVQTDHDRLPLVHGKIAIAYDHALSFDFSNIVHKPR